MKSFKKCLIAAAIVPVILGSATVFARGGDHKDGMRMMDRCDSKGPESIMRQLNLTPKQRDEIRNIRRADHDRMNVDMSSFRHDMQQFRGEESDLLLSKTFSEEQATAFVKKMVEKQIQHRVHMLETRHEMISILTPEQKAKWSELRQQMSQNPEPCHRPGKGGPDFDKGPNPSPVKP